ncbi:MAG: hypothetical protein ACRDYY_11035 [Acidimicrobiales bacterium]
MPERGEVVEGVAGAAGEGALEASAVVELSAVTAGNEVVVEAGAT